MDTTHQRKSSFFKRVRSCVDKIDEQKLIELRHKNRFRRLIRKGIIIIILAHIIGITFNYLFFKYEFWDNDKDRGAISGEGLFNENYETPTYLTTVRDDKVVADQGWTKRESLWFYKISQGSNLLPYDFYMELELAKGDRNSRFNSNKNIQSYQYLTRKKTFSNPDALPIGFTKDTYKGKEYLGFSCAACHTSQINYYDKNDTMQAIRIDGAPAQSNLEKFILDLRDALLSTLEDPIKKERFVSNVMKRNGYQKLLSGGRNYITKQDVLDELKIISDKLTDYAWINRPDTPYGFSRLDAFGRIYNRILEHVIDENTLEKALTNALTKDEKEKLWPLIKTDLATTNTYTLVNTASKHLSFAQKQALFEQLFPPATAPVSYPYLWDIPFHDYLQWNGIVSNAGGGALGRNVGQVIGVFGTLDWNKNDDFSPTNFLIQSKSLLDQVSFHSSINVRNISRVEDLLKKLKSPQWPEEKLGLIDPTKSARGKRIFQDYCHSCHGSINRENTQRRITAHISSIESVGTDPQMAKNSIGHTGYTGILQGSYVDMPAGKIILQEKAPVALMVIATTENTIKTPDMDTNILLRWSDWLYDLFFTFKDNPIEGTIKMGDYTPDSTNKPFASLLSYKARPLNGIWATAPYLHNGSVPTLYDLLLPQSERPKTFLVGSRIFDRVNVGFKSDNYTVEPFDTTQKGNLNIGHEYAAGITALPNGEKLPPLNIKQRYDLIEYLKSL